MLFYIFTSFMGGWKTEVLFFIFTSFMANEKEVDCIGSVLKGAVNSSSLSFPSYTPDSRERERERGAEVLFFIFTRFMALEKEADCIESH